MLVLTGPFTPMLFMGEEWAASTPWAFFTSHPDEELGEATRKGRLGGIRQDGLGPEPGARPAGRCRRSWIPSSIGRSSWPASMPRCWQLYRELAVLRRSRPELTDPRFSRNHTTFDDDEKWLLVERSGLRIAVNMSDETRTIPLDGPAGSLLLATQSGAELNGESLSLPATYRRCHCAGRRMTPPGRLRAVGRCPLAFR